MPSIAEANLVGKIQDISRALELANPAETPFITMVKKGKKPNNTLLEYPIDKYRDARVEGVIDGQDAAAFENTQENRAMLYSRVMRQWSNPMVTTMAQVVTDQAGDDGSKIAQSVAKSVEELKQDMEKTALGAQDSVAGTSAVAAVTRGLGSWISTSAQADTATAVPAAFRPASGQINTGTLAAFEEDELRTMLQTRYETVKSAGDLVGLFGTSVKNKVSDFTRYEGSAAITAASVRRFDGGTTTVTTAVDIYKGDYGTIKFFLDLFLPSQLYAYILDMNKLQVRPARNPTYEELQDGGGGPRGIVDCIWALAVTNPQAHCKAVVTA